MNTLDLGTLQRLTAQTQKLQSVAAELQPFLELVKELDGKLIIPTDRLIRAGEAAEILSVSKSTIGAFVKAGLLKPYYVIGSNQRRFKLSEVNSLIKEEPQNGTKDKISRQDFLRANLIRRLDSFGIAPLFRC